MGVMMMVSAPEGATTEGQGLERGLLSLRGSNRVRYEHRHADREACVLHRESPDWVRKRSVGQHTERRLNAKSGQKRRMWVCGWRSERVLSVSSATSDH